MRAQAARTHAHGTRFARAESDTTTLTPRAALTGTLPAQNHTKPIDMVGSTTYTAGTAHQVRRNCTTPIAPKTADTFRASAPVHATE